MQQLDALRLASAQLASQAVHLLQACQKVARPLAFPCPTVLCLRARQTKVRVVPRFHALQTFQMLPGWSLSIF